MKHIPIFFSCDKNYIPFLSVTIHSMQTNASKDYIYDIFVLNTGIDQESIDSLKIYEKENFNIKFVDISQDIETIKDKFFARDYYTFTTYYRLFIPRMYPEIDKCLYLDCDIIINGDISKLYSFDIGENYVGGITDEIVSKTEEFRTYVANRLGVTHQNYINAGILVMNLKKLREIDFETKFLKVIDLVKFKVAQDQDYINFICKDNISYLPKTWNKQPLKDDEIKDNEINLIHFNLNLKPWHYDNILYEDIFWNYAKQTSYYNQIAQMKLSYSLEKKQKDFIDGENLKNLALKEAELGGVIINE